MRLAIQCYEITKAFPSEERFGLAREIRRTAVSIPSNVAEGFNRRSEAAYLNHVCIALGSQAELETQLELGNRTGFITAQEWQELQDAVTSAGRLLHGLVRALEHR